MAIVNRDLDSSQQVYTMTGVCVALANGATYGLAVVPRPSQLIAAQTQSNGLTNIPNHELFIQRFVVGAGVTSILIGNTLAITTFGTSGAQGYSIPGGVTYPLQTGDVLLLASSNTNAHTLNTTVTFVLKSLQDIQSSFGV